MFTIKNTLHIFRVQDHISDLTIGVEEKVLGVGRRDRSKRSVTTLIFKRCLKNGVFFLHICHQNPLKFSRVTHRHKNRHHGVRRVGYHFLERRSCAYSTKGTLSNHISTVGDSNQNKPPIGRWKENLPQDMFETRSRCS